MTNFEAVLSSLPPVGSSAPDRSVASRATAATARHRTARGCRDLRGAVSVRSRGRPWLKGRKYGKWQIHIYIYVYIFIYLFIYLSIYLFIDWLWVEMEAVLSWPQAPGPIDFPYIYIHIFPNHSTHSNMDHDHSYMITISCNSMAMD